MESTTVTTAPDGRLFAPGKICITPGALAAFEDAYHGDWLLDAHQLRIRHTCGDGGDLDAHDQAANRDALKTGARILSAYNLPDGTRVWIITEAEDDDGVRESTTILLPSEY